jgi:hypothetical protein
MTICSILNTAFALANEAEILAIAHAQGVGRPYLGQLNGCMFCKGADLTQMNTLPEIVLPEPRNNESETDAAYEQRTAAINTAEINKVISASPHKVMIINSVSDFHLVTRQHGGLIPIGEL